MPLFSVLIPSYNRPNFIDETVKSVLNNRFDDFELLISDDKSPKQDEIAKILQPYLEDTRVHLYTQEENLGEPTNRDLLFEKAIGEWQIVLSDDDKLYPDALPTLAEAIDTYPKADLFAFGYTIINEIGNRVYSRKAPNPLRVSIDKSKLARELLVSDLFPFWMYQPATFCAKKEVHETIESNRDVGIGDDLMFMIDFINSGGVLQILPETLMCYRKMGGADKSIQLNQSAGDMPQLIARAKILNDLQNRLDLHPVYNNYVKSYECRKRLLYNPVIWNGVPIEKLLCEISFSSEFAAELKKFVSEHNTNLYKLRLVLNRAITFISIFGLAGVNEMIRVLLDRMSLKRKN